MQVDWTPKRVSALIALWNEGLSTAEIGRRLDVTKNAVVGKVHRLGLPKRQSPIRTGAKKKAAAKPAAEKKAAKTTAAAKPAPEKKTAASAEPVKTPTPIKKIAPAMPKGEVISLEMLSHGMCSWPTGEPGTDDFHFCGQPSVEGKPYCEGHCEIAYVRSSKESKSNKGEAAA